MEFRCYIVDIDRDDRRALVLAYTVGLGVVHREARSFECDIPWVASDDWPDDARAAARHLSTISVRRRQESDDYHRTGVVKNFSEADWDAFVTFSPYAFDGTVWAERGSLASFADTGASLSLWLTDDEVAHLRLRLPALHIRQTG